MKVASYLKLKNTDKEFFFWWIENLPITIKEYQKESLWKRSRNKKSLLWRTKKGFKFF